MFKISDLDDILHTQKQTRSKNVIEAALNDFQKELTDTYASKRDPKITSIYDSLFGEGNNRIYLTDTPVAFEMNEDNEKVKKAVKQVNSLVDFMNKIAENSETDYTFIDKNIKKKHYDPITIENLKTGKMGYSLKQVRGTKKDQIDIGNFIDNVKSVYNYLYDIFENFNKTGDKTSITKEQLYDWIVELRELNINGVDRDLKKTLSNFYSINGKKLRADDLICIISRDPIDLAGASTGRTWRSCMRFPDRRGGSGGGFENRLYNGIQHGSLISYLTSASDKNIENPRARIIIQPYFDNPDDLVNSNRALVSPEKIYGDGTFDGRLSIEELEERKNKPNYNPDYGWDDVDYNSLPNFVLRNFLKITKEWVEDANEILMKDAPEFTEYRRAKNSDTGFLYYEDRSGGKVIKGLEKIKDTLEVKQNLQKYYAGEIDSVPYNVGDVIKLSENSFGIIIGKNYDRIENFKSKIFTVANTEKPTAALTILVNRYIDSKSLRIQNSRTENDKSCGFFQSEISTQIHRNSISICGNYNDVVVPVWKLLSGDSNSGDTTRISVTNCKLFLLSVPEIFGNGMGVANNREGKQYEYFKTHSNKIVLNSWTRSLYVPTEKNDNVSPATFDYIDNKGEVQFTLSDETNETPHKVLPCFCI